MQIAVALVAVVALLAQGLQPTGQELIPVTIMGYDMVSHCSRPDLAALQTEGAQWIVTELQTPKPTPAL